MLRAKRPEMHPMHAPALCASCPQRGLEQGFNGAGGMGGARMGGNGFMGGEAAGAGPSLGFAAAAATGAGGLPAAGGVAAEGALGTSKNPVVMTFVSGGGVLPASACVTIAPLFACTVHRNFVVLAPAAWQLLQAQGVPAAEDGGVHAHVWHSLVSCVVCCPTSLTTGRAVLLQPGVAHSAHTGWCIPHGHLPGHTAGR